MRPKTIGNCRTREELEEKVVWYYHNTELSIADVARRFGIASTTADNILAAARKRQIQETPDDHDDADRVRDKKAEVLPGAPEREVDH